MILTDGAFHAVDSSELAFRLATIGAFREVYRAANPVILEPIMTVEVVAPVDFQSMILFFGNESFPFILIFLSDFRPGHRRIKHKARDHYGQRSPR